MKAIELEKAYNPKDFEDRIYNEWDSKGYFKPASDKESPVHAEYEAKSANLSPEELKAATYAVVIPPPNVTGVLHMGHALDDTLQDILIRYNRMLGKKVLWQPCCAQVLQPLRWKCCNF